MVKVSIAGGTGYTAGELIRILINHPFVQIVSVTSTTMAGTLVCDVHKDLIGDCDLKFSEVPAECDVLFLCLGHGISREFLESNEIGANCRVIDLGNDFRLDGNFGDREFVYGICELNRESISAAKNIANPGCFATSIILGSAPLLKLCPSIAELHVSAITGSTGSGKRLADTGHFSYRDNNISIYKLFKHQHLSEIALSLASYSGSTAPHVNFVPFRGDFTRGIISSIYAKMDSDYSVKIVKEAFLDTYSSSPFVHVVEHDSSLKEVVNTNKALLKISSGAGNIHITSIIDNLLKGASGQAVQNMNIMFGFAEDTGLRLKGSAF